MMSFPPQSFPAISLPQNVSVEEVAARPSSSIPFACVIPNDASVVPKDPDAPLVVTQSVVPVNVSIDTRKEGIVGIITLLGSNSVKIWFGWGRLLGHDEAAAATPQKQVQTNAVSVGSGASRC
jgi:hypothetical protein